MATGPVRVDAAGWVEAARATHDAGHRLVALWGSERGDALAVAAAYARADGLQVFELGVPAADASYPDLSGLFPAANRMQRALRDLVGLEAEGAADRRRWLRHGAWGEAEFPLRSDFDPGRARENEPDDYRLVRVEGDGVHEIAVGPIHAGIIEPGHFRFSVVGEKVLRLEQRLGYVHKGIDRRFADFALADGHRLAGRVSGDSTVAYAWAYAQAAEAIAGFAAPARAAWLRALMLERERIANHLGDLGALGNDGGFGFALAQFMRVKVKVVDAPADEPPAELARAVCRELESEAPEVEVAWSGGVRRTVATRRQPAQDLPKGPRIAGGNWIVTGGARGITAASALELGRRFGVTLHLLGKSPAPQPGAPWRNCTDLEFKSLKAAIVREAIDSGRSPAVEWDRVRKDREIEQSLQKFQAAGVKATYHECDVADAAQLGTVLDKIRAADGPIEGVVHGAGYAKQFRFGAAPADSVRRVMAPKVEGTLALMHLTQNDPLKYFVAFGSLSGCFGGNGWSDYAAANDMLGKLCGWFRESRPEVRTATLHWQTWSEVGMAVITDSVGINKNTFKMDFIAPAEGVVHLADELELGLPESEVLISDGFFERAFYSYEFERPDAPLAHRPAVCRESQKPTAIPATAGPLLVSLVKDASGGATAQVVFDPKADPFLIEHRLKSKPFVPAVVGMETLVEVARALGGPREVFELRNVSIVNGLAFPTDNPIAATVTATASGAGLACALTIEVRDRQGRVIDPAKRLIEAIVPPTSEPIVARPPTSPPLGWYPYAYSDDVLLFHGPPLRCLKEVGYVYEGGWGKILAPPADELAGPRSRDGWLLPMAVLDACEVACGSFLYLLFGGAIEVPYEFERLRWSRAPRTGESCIVLMRFRGRKERHSLFDFTLYGDDKQPILDAVGYRTVLIGGGEK